MVRISVDGDFDLVSANLGQTGDLDVLNRAITALTAVRDQLAELDDGRAPRGGRCLAEDDRGRCRSPATHQSAEHSFPTEADHLPLGCADRATGGLITTTTTAVRIWCPSWCTVAEQTHLDDLDSWEGRVIHSSDDFGLIHGEDYALSALTLPDGTPQPEQPSHAPVMCIAGNG